MNIYIYGNNSLKKEIHKTLDHSNIKFKLDSNSTIEDIEDLEVLKAAIETNPNDIYLIDDEKIIKKNALSKKIKFLLPKNGIEEEFLLDKGIADLSVDSLKEIPEYILNKYEQQKEVEPSIQSSIIDIVYEAYKEDNKDLDIELDDESSQLLSSSISEKKDINLDEIEDLINNDDSSENESTNGDDMPSDLIELDSLNEQDVLSALAGISTPNSSSNNITTNTNNEKVEIESSNVQDIAELISKLLNKKTLEITIKIKD